MEPETNQGIYLFILFYLIKLDLDLSNDSTARHYSDPLDEELDEGFLEMPSFKLEKNKFAQKYEKNSLIKKNLYCYIYPKRIKVKKIF